MRAEVVRHLLIVTQQYGVFGLGLGMFLESIGIPFASAFVALTAGTLITSGKTTFFEVLLITTTGLTLGSIVSYYIGYWGSLLGRNFTEKKKDKLENSPFLKQYKRWGEIAILFAQLFGTTRTWASIPAGIMKMKFSKFILFTIIGGAIYCALAISFSLVLATFYARIIVWLQVQYQILFIISIIVIFIGLYYFIHKRKRVKCKDADSESKNNPVK